MLLRKPQQFAQAPERVPQRDFGVGPLIPIRHENGFSLQKLRFLTFSEHPLLT
jgi:hypothetical protein